MALTTVKPADLTYRAVDSLFTCFFPETLAGDEAWDAMAAQTDGTGKVLHSQVPAVLAQLRAAGYVVRKGAKPKPVSDADLLALLGE